MSTNIETFLTQLASADSVEVNNIFYGKSFTVCNPDEETGIVFEGKFTDNDHTVYQFDFDKNNLQKISFDQSQNAWIGNKANNEKFTIRLYRNQVMAPDSIVKKTTKEDIIFQLTAVDWEIGENERKKTNADPDYDITGRKFSYGGVLIDIKPKKEGAGEPCQVAIEISRNKPCIHIFSGDEYSIEEITITISVDDGHARASHGQSERVEIENPDSRGLPVQYLFRGK